MLVLATLIWSNGIHHWPTSICGSEINPSILKCCPSSRHSLHHCTIPTAHSTIYISLSIQLYRNKRMCYLSSRHVNTSKAGLSFLKFLICLRLLQELMNQYQACLYSFGCISHGDSKYGHEIPKCCHFLTSLWHDFVPVVCSSCLPHGESYLGDWSLKREVCVEITPKINHGECLIWY